MSQHSWRERVLAGAAWCALVSTSACAGTPAPYRVHYADVAHGGSQGYDGKRPLVVELAAGDRIPVHLQLDAEDVDLVPARPPLELVAKHHCYVRFWSDGIRASLDPEHFDEKPRIPGRFRIGLTAERGQDTRLDVIIVTPRR